MSVISNTTVLTNFAEIGQITVLAAIFETLFIPTEVFAELAAGVADGYAFLAPLVESVVPPAEQGWLASNDVCQRSGAAGDEPGAAWAASRRSGMFGDCGTTKLAVSLR